MAWLVLVPAQRWTYPASDLKRWCLRISWQVGLAFSKASCLIKGFSGSWTPNKQSAISVRWLMKELFVPWPCSTSVSAVEDSNPGAVLSKWPSTPGGPEPGGQGRKASGLPRCYKVARPKFSLWSMTQCPVAQGSQSPSPLPSPPTPISITQSCCH